MWNRKWYWPGSAPGGTRWCDLWPWVLSEVPPTENQPIPAEDGPEHLRPRREPHLSRHRSPVWSIHTRTHTHTMNDITSWIYLCKTDINHQCLRRFCTESEIKTTTTVLLCFGLKHWWSGTTLRTAARLRERERQVRQTARERQRKDQM